MDPARRIRRPVGARRAAAALVGGALAAITGLAACTSSDSSSTPSSEQAPQTSATGGQSRPSDSTPAGPSTSGQKTSHAARPSGTGSGAQTDGTTQGPEPPYVQLTCRAKGTGSLAHDRRIVARRATALAYFGSTVTISDRSLVVRIFGQPDVDVSGICDGLPVPLVAGKPKVVR